MNKKNCFLIAPINKENSPERIHSDKVKRNILDPVLKSMGYDAKRGDQEPEPGIITEHIIQRVTQYPLVIAILKGNNPNVFYELAVRHTAAKPCIQLAERGEPIPFDVSQLQTIIYDISDPDSVTQAKKELKKQIEAVEKGGHPIRNPVTSAIEVYGLRSSGSPLENSMADMISKIDELNNKITMLQGQLNLMGQGGTGGDSVAQFLSRTSIHHQFVHKLRDLCVREMPKLDQFLPDGLPASEPHPLLEKARGDLISALEDIVRMYELLVAPGTKIWACLRDRRSDDCYHTLARAGRFHQARGESSKPMHKENSVTVQRLKESFNGGRCVIITGSGRGPSMWEPQENDTFGEDRSVLMSAVMAKSWLRNAWGNKKLMMILSVCADQDNAFGEKHIPLMQCFTDVFSLVVNVLLRSAAGDWRWEANGDELTHRYSKHAQVRT